MYKVAPATKDYGPKQPPTNLETLYSGTTSYGPSYAHLDNYANKACQTASPTPTLSNSEDNKDNRAYRVSKDNRAYKVQLVYVARQAHKVYREYKENAEKKVLQVQPVNVVKQAHKEIKANRECKENAEKKAIQASKAKEYGKVYGKRIKHTTKVIMSNGIVYHTF